MTLLMEERAASWSTQSLVHATGAASSEGWDGPVTGNWQWPNTENSRPEHSTPAPVSVGEVQGFRLQTALSSLPSGLRT